MNASKLALPPLLGVPPIPASPKKFALLNPTSPTKFAQQPKPLKFSIPTSQLPQLLLAAACLQTIFFAGSLSWFTDGLPALTATPELASNLPGLLCHLPHALLAAGSHTSSFTVGCFVAVFLRAAIPTNLKITKTTIVSTFATLTIVYFLVCFLWFSAIVPRIISTLGTVFPAVMALKEDTRKFDIISTSDIDHSLVASGSHTLSWLIGMLLLCFERNVVTRRMLQKLIVFTTVFATVSATSKLAPSAICTAVVGCVVVLLASRKKVTANTKLDIMSLVCVVVAGASSLTKLSRNFDFERNIVALVNWWLAEALTPNLPFCEEPFAMSPYLAQGASCLAHLPFVPAIILGLAGVCPELMPTLNKSDTVMGKDASAIKRILWLQFAVQAYTGIGGHALPNPRMICNQEVSISITFGMLFLLVKFTTEDPNNVISLHAGTALCLTPVLLYFTIGLMPLIFMSFIAAVLIGTSVKAAFGRFTPAANKILLAVFLPTMGVLALETVGCAALQGIARNVPWHLAFDLMFWQVVGSTVDVVIMSPPGKFLKPWSTPKARRASTFLGYGPTPVHADSPAAGKAFFNAD